MTAKEVQTLADAIRRDYPEVTPGTDLIWTAAPPVQVIDCVLSLNRKYDTFVLPRVVSFIERFPEIQSCHHLRRLIDTYPTPAAFLENTLNYRYPAVANTLSDVVSYLIEVQDKYTSESEAQMLRQWACDARPGDYETVGVKGFGLAGFQYLRMLFGAETAKPDVHIKNYISEVVGRSVSDVHALQLLEEAASLAEIPLRWLDVAIWESRVR